MLSRRSPTRRLTRNWNVLSSRSRSSMLSSCSASGCTRGGGVSSLAGRPRFFGSGVGVGKAASDAGCTLVLLLPLFAGTWLVDSSRTRSSVTGLSSCRKQRGRMEIVQFSRHVKKETVSGFGVPYRIAPRGAADTTRPERRH